MKCPFDQIVIRCDFLRLGRFQDFFDYKISFSNIGRNRRQDVKVIDGPPASHIKLHVGSRRPFSASQTTAPLQAPSWPPEAFASGCTSSVRVASAKFWQCPILPFWAKTAILPRGYLCRSAPPGVIGPAVWCVWSAAGV